MITSVLAAPMMAMVGAVSVVTGSEATFTVAFRPARSVTLCAVAPWPSCAVITWMLASVVGAARLKVPPPYSTSVLPLLPEPVSLSPLISEESVATNAGAEAVTTLLPST